MEGRSNQPLFFFFGWGNDMIFSEHQAGYLWTEERRWGIQLMIQGCEVVSL